MQLKWPGFNENGNVIIGLAADSFCLAENKIDIFDESFIAKEELHVTLISSELGSLLQDKIKQHQAGKNILEKIFEEIDWSFTQTGPVHMLTRTEEGVVEKSIILLIDMPGVKTFYEQLKKLGLTDFDTPVPPAHITLYTQNCRFGIGVQSNEVLDALSVKTLALNEFKALLNH